MFKEKKTSEVVYYYIDFILITLFAIMPITLAYDVSYIYRVCLLIAILIYIILVKDNLRSTAILFSLLPYENYLNITWNIFIYDYIIIAYIITNLLKYNIKYSPKQISILITLLMLYVCTLFLSAYSGFKMPSFNAPIRMFLYLFSLLIINYHISKRTNYSLIILYLGFSLIISISISLLYPNIIWLHPTRALKQNMYREIYDTVRFGALYSNPGNAVRYFSVISSILLLEAYYMRKIVNVFSIFGVVIFLIGFLSLSKQYVAFSLLILLQIVILFVKQQHITKNYLRYVIRIVFVIVFVVLLLANNITIIKILEYRFFEQSKKYGILSRRDLIQSEYIQEIRHKSLTSILFGNGNYNDYSKRFFNLNGSPENAVLEYIIIYGVISMMLLIIFYQLFIKTRLTFKSNFLPFILFVLYLFTLSGIHQTSFLYILYLTIISLNQKKFVYLSFKKVTNLHWS